MKLRVLVAIANHGTRNRRFLDRLLAEYRGMVHDVDVVVLSDQPKQLGHDVEVMVGAPTSDPWSLPFGHRQVFADRREDYDVFVYSEDDTLIEARHIEAFIELSAVVPADLLPGFMRYEVMPGGDRSYCTIHSYYRWDPASIRRHGGLTFASFTNAHGACYALTRSQLARALASGGFLVAPHSERYDMLVTAATDVYTQCGFQKVLCMERMEDLLVRHLPDAYVGQLGVTPVEFNAQLAAILMAAENGSPVTSWLVPEVDTSPPMWSKACFPLATEGLVELVAALGARRRPARVLSLGCVSGVHEAALVEAGMEVVGVPVDPILGAVAASRGVTVVPPSPGVGARARDAGPYDVVLAIDVLPYLQDPVVVLREAADVLVPGGHLVATIPDHARYRLLNAVPGTTRRPLPRSWEADGSHRSSVRRLRRWIRDAGLCLDRIDHRRATRYEPFGVTGERARVAGNTVMAVASAPPATPVDASAVSRRPLAVRR